MSRRPAILAALLLGAVALLVATRPDGGGPPSRAPRPAAGGAVEPVPPEAAPGDRAAADAEANPAPAGASLMGRVVDPDGRPVADAIVVADTPETARAVADADGRYRLDGLPAGDRLVAAGRRGAEPAPVARVRIPDVTRLDIELPPAAVLTGIVRREDTGAPVPGAVVLARRSGFEGEARARAVADADGVYRIDSLSPGTVEMLWARAGDLGCPDAIGADAEPVLSEGVPAVVDIVLVAWPADRPMENEYEESEWWGAGPWTVEEGGVRIHGTVRTAAGAPAAGARVRAWRGVPGPGTTGTGVGSGAAAGVTVGADGSFDFRFDPGGETVSLFATAPGSAPLGPRLVDVPDGADSVSVDLVLEAGAEIAGRVFAAESGAPVPGAAVRLLRPAGRFDEIVCGAEEPPEVVATAAVDGTFRIRDVPAGRFRVVADAPGRMAGGAFVRLPGAGPVEIALPRALALGGRVRFEDGTPAPGVYLESRPAAGGEWASGGMTAPDGSFLLRELPPGPRLLRTRGAWRTDGPWTAGDFVDAEFGPYEPDRRDLELRLCRGLSISGRVLGPDGAPVAGAEVSFLDAADGFSGEEHTGADGDFERRALRPGIHRIVVREDGFAPASVEGVPAGTRDVTVRLDRGLSISGRVVDDDGRAVAGQVVRASTRGIDAWPRSDDASGRTDAEGRFRIDGLPSGAFLLVPDPGVNEAPRALLPAAPVPAGSSGLELVLSGEPSLAGVVRDEGGDPVAGADVGLEPAIYGRRRSAVTDGEGRFRLPGLPPGPAFAVTAEADGLVSRRLAGLSPGGGRLEIVLGRPRSIRGRAVAATGEPLANVEIRLVPEDGGGQTHARTDDRGAFRIDGLAPGRFRAAAGWYEDERWTEVDLGEVDAGAADAVLRER